MHRDATTAMKGLGEDASGCSISLSGAAVTNWNCCSLMQRAFDAHQVASKPVARRMMQDDLRDSFVPWSRHSCCCSRSAAIGIVRCERRGQYGRNCPKIRHCVYPSSLRTHNRRAWLVLLIAGCRVHLCMGQGAGESLAGPARCSRKGVLSLILAKLGGRGSPEIRWCGDLLQIAAIAGCSRLLMP